MNQDLVTVLIVTRDRARLLRRYLPTVLLASREGPFDVEVLIIDNGSEDETARVLEEFAAPHPNLRVVYHGAPGRSRALNRGLFEAKGRVIVYTDDDVAVPKSWIEDMATPILTGSADVVCGRVVLAAELDRPWLTPALRSQLAELTDVSGGAPGMVGANMATRADIARAIGFDETLGAGARGFAEDVLFNFRVKHAGYRLAGCAGPPVTHYPTIDRLRYRDMKTLAIKNGKSHAYLHHHWLGAEARWPRVKIFVLSLQLMPYSWRSKKRVEGIDEKEYFLIKHVSFLKQLRLDERTARVYGS